MLWHVLGYAYTQDTGLLLRNGCNFNAPFDKKSEASNYMADSGSHRLSTTIFFPYNTLSYLIFGTPNEQMETTCGVSYHQTELRPRFRKAHRPQHVSVNTRKNEP